MVTMCSEEPPKPGIYRDVPMEKYHSWDALSNSQLSKLEKSPAHLEAYREEEFEESDAMRLGQVIHAAALEPERFEHDYEVIGDCEGTKNDGDPCTYNAKVLRPSGAYCNRHDPFNDIEYVGGGWYRTPTGTSIRGEDNVEEWKEEVMEKAPDPISEDDMEVCEGVCESLERNKAARALLRGQGDVELTIVWRDPMTGVLCKGRIDRRSPHLPGGALVDLKTTRDAEYDSFQRSVFNYGYHRQAAFYLMGGQALEIEAEHFCLLAVEKEPPYGIMPYRVKDRTIEDVSEKIQALIQLYKDCREKDKWPGYPEEIQDMGLPAWASDKMHDSYDRIYKYQEAVNSE